MVARKPTASDYRYAVNRLAKELGVPYKDAAGVYDSACYDYNRAKASGFQMLAVMEAREQANRAIVLHYRADILPAIRRWFGDDSINPMGVGDAFRLWEELLRRGAIAYTDPPQDGFFTFHITDWRGVDKLSYYGIGKAELLTEALILAWWSAYDRWWEQNR